MKLQLLPLVLVTLLVLSCGKDEIDPGNDPNFTIVANDDGILRKCNRKVVAFGIDIYANKRVDDHKLLHAANVMAQYLDNDEDGEVDNPLVLEKMQEKKAFVVMWNRRMNLLFASFDGREGQDLGNRETHPSFVSNGCSGDFDASLEEIFHIITHAGYSNAYPDVFGEQKGSQLCDAMDIARGGQYTNIPDDYPSDAWYTYTDKTCEYNCQATEYFYWAMTSILGAQKNRSSEIGHEWEPHTPELVEQKDPAIYSLLTDSQYKLPTVLPDGTYMR